MAKTPEKKSPLRDEFNLIERYFAPLSNQDAGAFGLLDDAAVLQSAGHNRRLATTMDTMVADVHFRANDKPGDIGWKLLAVNLSDLAAMGAEPQSYLLSVALNDTVDDAWLADFCDGLSQCQQAFDIHLVGGDTVKTPGPVTLTVCAVGRVEKDAALQRATAQAGDCVFVSGSLGDGAMGLAALQGALSDLSEPHRSFLIQRYHRPTPRLALGRQLRGVASAVADISDGLVADLEHICSASHLGARIRFDAVPLSDAGRAAIKVDPDLQLQALVGGDDFELVFTAPETCRQKLVKISNDYDVAITEIGQMMQSKQPKVVVVDGAGGEIALKNTGYAHF